MSKSLIRRMLVIVGAFLVLPWVAESGEAEAPPFRVAFSSQVLRGVNEADARAAIKAWANSVVRERGIDVVPDAEVIKAPAAMVAALKSARCEYAAMPTEQFLDLETDQRPDSVYLSVTGGNSTEEYVLVVHADSGRDSIGDLIGGQVTLFDSPRACLAEAWLDVALMERGLSRASITFPELKTVAKLPGVVLPVFFKQSDACVVTAHGFDTMVELNPQVGRELRVLARSSPLVPTVSFFRQGYNDDIRARIESEMNHLRDTAAGGQVLNLFQSDDVALYPVSHLDDTQALLRRRASLLGGASPRESATGTTALSLGEGS